VNLTLFAIMLLSTAACSILISSSLLDPHRRMAQPAIADSVLVKGSHRTDVITQFGQPDSTFNERGKRIDVYYLAPKWNNPDDPKGNKGIASIVFVDLYSAGAFEPVFTAFALYARYRVATGHTANQVFLTYSENDELESWSAGEKP
jgi:hypothetical protein